MNAARRVLDRLVGAVLSAPVFVKILGIGLLVAGVFGSVTLAQTRQSVSATLSDVLSDRTVATTRALAVTLERAVVLGDHEGVAAAARRARTIEPTLRFVVVADRDGEVIADTFDGDTPPSVIAALPRVRDGGDRAVVLDTPHGRLFTAASPILDGHGGTVYLGVRDSLVRDELARTNRAVLIGLIYCLFLGVLLAVALTYAITRPIRNLVHVAKEIGQESFEARAHVYSDDEIGRLAVAFNDMAEGLQRYRAEVGDKERARVVLLDRLVQAQEDERQRLSLELHDHIGQSLLALQMALEADAPDRESPAIHEAGRRVRDLITEVRHLAWAMRPSVLDDYGIDSALERYIRELRERIPIDIDYQYSAPAGASRPESRTEVTLYRIAQEALTNVVRHARASSVSVVVLQRLADITMLVEDDGIGFVPPAGDDSARAGLGLTSMRERAALIGGSCVVESHPGRGTTIRVRIPTDAVPVSARQEAVI